MFFSRDAVPVKANDLIRLTTPGGGGWGDPLERDIELARMDVIRRLVSIGSAEKHYGIVMDPDTHEVDVTATEKLRKEIAEERGPVKLIDRGPYAETLIKKGLIEVSDPELECTRCAGRCRARPLLEGSLQVHGKSESLRTTTGPESEK